VAWQETTEPETTGSIDGVVGRTIDGFVDGLVAAVPRIVSGLLFLLLAVVLVRVVLWIVDRVLGRTVSEESAIYRQFVKTVVSVFLWFGVILGFLSVVGLDQIAAALGTASGFLALGVSYALSDMIADAVAGIYLLRDPDFNVGDRITAGDTTGVVKQIELRKTRIQVEDDTVVRGNANIEERWTRISE